MTVIFDCDQVIPAWQAVNKDQDFLLIRIPVKFKPAFACRVGDYSMQVVRTKGESNVNHFGSRIRVEREKSLCSSK